MTQGLLTRRALVAASLAMPALATRPARAAGAWTREAYLDAMAKSGRPVSLTQAQFDAIQARKPAAMKRIEQYLKERLGHADPAVMAAFEAVPREYFHYLYDSHRATPGDAYEANPKPWALGFGSALSDYLGQAYMTQVAAPKPDDISELLYQIRKFHGFLWASGGCYSDFLIHNIDECCWVKDAWPVKAEASGARTYRNGCIDQNFDTYSVEYTFEDGSKFFLEGRNLDGCKSEFASYAHGSKNSAVISTAAHSPAKCRIYKGQKLGSKKDLIWAVPQPEPNPYQLEWDHLVEAIRTDHPYNEVERGVKASLVTSMGRMAAHTGEVITFDDT